MLPAESVVPVLEEVTDASTDGFSPENRSKCGPFLTAPCQCVVSTDKMPLETASMSYKMSEGCMETR